MLCDANDKVGHVLHSCSLCVALDRTHNMQCIGSQIM